MSALSTPLTRRGLLRAAGAGLTVSFLAGCALPVIPKRPSPDATVALGWIRYVAGRYVLFIPRVEMGQNILTALKQLACEELGMGWEQLDALLPDTTQISRVRATVGSDSIKDFALPLAQACATLRDALRAGVSRGELKAVERPVGELRSMSARTGLRHIGRLVRIEQGVAIVRGQPLFAADVRRPRQVYGRILRAPASPELESRPTAMHKAAAQAVPGFIALVQDDLLLQGASLSVGTVARTPGALDRIEPRAAVAEFAADGRLHFWVGTQGVFYQRDVITERLGLDDDEVVVHEQRLGGGFGGKTICTVELEAAVLARATRAPVKVQWSRAQELRMSFNRPPSSHRIKARMKAGRIDQWGHGFASNHLLFTNAVVPPWRWARPAWSRGGLRHLQGDELCRGGDGCRSGPRRRRVRVTHLVCAHDCGRVVSPDQVRAQCEGYLVWGLGMALVERLTVGDSQVAAATFGDSPIPRMGDVPPMKVLLVDEGEPPTGPGETAIVAAAAAIANAVRDALGVRTGRLPIDQDALSRPSPLT